MANEKKLVEQITSMEDDFAQWYTDIVKTPNLILLRELTPPWLMRDSRFSPKPPTSHGLRFISTDTIFLSKGKF